MTTVEAINHLEWLAGIGSCVDSMTLSDDYLSSFVDAASALTMDCSDCRWKNARHQKCSCCRRNIYMKDNYEVK